MRLTKIFCCFFLLGVFVSVRGQYLNTDITAQRLRYSLDKYLQGEPVNALTEVHSVYAQLIEDAQTEVTQHNEEATADYLEILLQLSLGNSLYEQKAFLYLRKNVNKFLIDRLSFALGVYLFEHKRYAECLVYTKDLTFEYFQNEQSVCLKFIQAYSYFAMQDPSKALILFDLLRQIPYENPFYADAYYYYAYLQLSLGGDLSLALKGFYVIENNEYYAKVVPYYVAALLYMLDLKANAQQYIEEKLATSPNIQYLSDLKKLLVKIYFENNQYKQIIDVLQRGFVEETDEERFYVGVSYFKVDSFDRAIQMLTQINYQNDSLGFEINFILAQSYLNKKNIQKANQLFYYCVENPVHTPFNDFILFLYAKTSLSLHKNNLGLSSLKDLLTLYPKSKYANEAKQLLIQNYANTNNFKEAIVMLNGFGSMSNKKILSKIYYGRAVELYTSGDADSALFFLEKNIALRNEDAYTSKAFFLAGEVEYNKANYAKASLYYEKSLQLLLKAKQKDLRTELQLKYHLGYCFFKTEKYSQSLPYFNEVMEYKNVDKELSMYQYDVLLRIGDAYLMTRQYSLATATYNRYLLDSSTNQKDYALYQQAIIAGIHNPSEKINKLQIILTQFPQTNLKQNILTEIGNTQMGANKFEDAILAFQELLSDTPSKDIEPSVLLNIGLSYRNLSQNNQAFDYLKKTVELYPNSNEAEQALLFLKDIFLEKGDIDGYLQIAQKSGRYVEDESSDSLYFTTAEIKNREKNYTDALFLFQTYLLKYPHSKRREQALYYILHILLLQKNYSLAYQIEDTLLQTNTTSIVDKSLLLMVTKVKDTSLYSKQQLLRYNALLYERTNNNEQRLMSLKNLVFLHYDLKEFSKGFDYALALEKETKTSNYDKAMVLYFYAKKYAKDSLFTQAIEANAKIIQLDLPSSVTAMASYDNATYWVVLGNFEKAEKQCFFVIDKFQQNYDLLVQTYLLLAEIYYKQKDFFNAKATLKSIISNSSKEVFRNQASTRLKEIQQEEALFKASSLPTSK